MDFVSSTRENEDRTSWRGIVDCCKVICGAPMTSQGYGID